MEQAAEMLVLRQTAESGEPPGCRARVYICDECVNVCLDIHQRRIMNEPGQKAQQSAYKLPKPKEITEILSEYVIEQDEGKEGSWRLRFMTHYKRITTCRTRMKTAWNLQKSNIVMIGPTGSGKTIAGTDTGKDSRCTVCHCGRYCAYRGRLCRRGRGKHPAQAASGSGL